MTQLLPRPLAFSSLSHACKESGYLIPSGSREPAEEGAGGGQKKYKGVAVLEPAIGAHSSPLSTLDVSSLYPRIMIAHNLSYERLVRGDCPSALVRALETMEEGVASRVIPGERTVMLREVSMTMRTAMESVRPPAVIKVKKNELIQRRRSMLEEEFTRVRRGIVDMMKWCKITAIDLSHVTIRAEDTAQLADVLGQCSSLAHLKLARSEIRAPGAGRLAAVLPQCPLLAHLDLCGNDVSSRGAWRLTAVLPRCASLPHLNLCNNAIKSRGVGRHAAVLPRCTSLAHLNGFWDGIEPEGAAMLPAVLPQCASLAHFDLRGDDIASLLVH